MESNKYYLGDLITQRREKNPGGDLPIRGVSREGLQPPKQIDADTSIYNLYYRNDFVYNPARMELGSIAFNDEYDKAICSSLYEVFYVNRTDLVIPEYLALFVKHSEFARYCNYIGNGSAREYCRFDNISGIPIYLPSIPEQQKIVHDYKVITDRIALLSKTNDNLYSFLNSHYESLTCDITSFVPLSSFCSYVNEKDTFGNLIMQNYVSTENLLQNKQGIDFFGSTEDDSRVTVFQVGDTLISNIRPYFKKIWFATSSGGCNADVLCFRAHNSRDACLVNAILYQDKFFSYVMSGAKGTKMPRGDKDHIMQYPVPDLTFENKEHFLILAEKVQALQSVNKREMDVLHILCDMFVSRVLKGA